MLSCQLAVIGAGSAGCGAALAASRLGIDTVLVENYPLHRRNFNVRGCELL